MQDAMEAGLAPRPDHVPADRVRDFDLYNVPGAAEDIQAAYAAIQQSSPDIFWTPRNGGHWVATRGEDILVMQRDHSRFSYQQIVLPPMPEGTPRQIPLEIDPPEHARYRRPLMQALLPSIVSELEENVRQVAIDAAERLRPLGECEFVEDFAKVLPIHVFLELVKIPLDDKAYLLTIAEDSVRGSTAEIRLGAQHAMGAYLLPWIRARRDNPGDDLLSKLVNVDISGERISEAEAISYATLVLFGGLDTVAGMIAFIARFLALNPGHRRQLVERIDDEAFLKNAIEELIRRHGLANTARIITHDFDYKDNRFRAGDRILPANLFVGVDDRITADPLEVDFDREKPVHAAFGNGAHACPGAVLARREIRIFLEEWLKRIPEFRIKPGTQPVLATGMVNGVLRLDLVWP
ncbi:cytochrome P450 [Rhizorhabdus dicambivorans]|uniref:Cytochrome P450 n=1 Tax=Rhizorhabdus dicambivorans TaxID=1850238 RepID=A0A2A4FTU7_9SPHN|nr:cytochrome P450 [Rhizorhabdus dicambivorans]ATE63961.1 cytochrome P450 [Rhizorhabdus dicambivorans]PCE41569.1 cytochrome P450 [Rhizorhabdus dicambivorans]